MRTLIRCFAWLVSVLVAPAAMAQHRGLAIEYSVKVADIPGQLFHVTTDIKNINQPSLELSLPVWSPGWYVPGVFSAEKTRTLVGHLAKLAETQGRIFGGLPYKKFVYFYFFRAAEASCSVLEHQNSFVSLWNPDALPRGSEHQAQDPPRWRGT